MMAGVTLDPGIIGVALLSVLILGLSKGGFAGIGMISTPLLSLVVPPQVAVGVLLPVLIFQDAISIYAYRRTFHARNLALLIPGGIVGILLGTLIASMIDRAMFELVLGFVALIFGIERLLRYFGGPPKPHRPNPIVGVICGVLAGFTSMIAHAGIPPFQFFVLPQRLQRDVYIGTSVIFYGVLNLVKLPFFIGLGQVGADSLVASFALMPVAFGSVLLGIRLVRRVSSDRYVLLANLILIAIAILLIWRGWSGLG